MEQGNAKFYHRHILSNIQQLDSRKDKYVYMRAEFLRQHCLPIQAKIDQIRAQIKHLQHMLDTQHATIEQQPEIASLKKQIEQYMDTQKYYKAHLSEYEEKAMVFNQRNERIKKQIKSLKTAYMLDVKETQLILPNITPSLYSHERYSSPKSKEDVRDKIDFRLPRISSVANSDNLVHTKIKLQKRQMIGMNRNCSMEIHPQRTQENEEATQIKSKWESPTIQKWTPTEKSQIRSEMTRFDRVETLFRECFELKKGQVQRDVAQLKSKLIVNRQEFLKVCEVIGAKEGKIEYDQFAKLSSEEVMTLFISFAWLNRRLNQQFLAKRRKIMAMIGSLPKIS